MRTDRYEREREKVRDSAMNDQTKLERLAMIDVREERVIERRIKRESRRLDALRQRMALTRDERQRQWVRAKLRRTLYRSLEDDQPEGA